MDETILYAVQQRSWIFQDIFFGKIFQMKFPFLLLEVDILLFHQTTIQGTIAVILKLLPKYLLFQMSLICVIGAGINSLRLNSLIWLVQMQGEGMSK